MSFVYQTRHVTEFATDCFTGRATQQYRFLDKELQQITKEAELGKRYADKLVQVYRNDGEEVWVLIHVEIQSQQDKNFPKRMFT